jgi:hypothetical protein
MSGQHPADICSLREKMVLPARMMASKAGKSRC